MDALNGRIALLASDRESGASEILDEVIAILRDAVAAGTPLLPVARAVCRAQPTMASVWNAALEVLAPGGGERSLLLAFLNLEGAVQAANFIVRVEDSYFDPLQLAVNVGDTVTWNGFGAQDHTVTSDTGVFDAIVLFGETFSHTFSQEGTYPYYCFNHGAPGGDGMSGVIVVSASTQNTSPARPANLSPPAGATNQPLTVQLQASAFSDPDPQDFHGASEWIIRRAADNVILLNTGADPVNKTNRAVSPGVLAYGSNYTWQVRYRDGRGQWSEYSLPRSFATLVPVAQTGTGLLASYDNITNLSPPLAVTTNATVAFDWGTARPHRRITADDFSVRWEGFILPQFTERYDLQLRFRGRARLWLNNQLLIDEWNGCSFSQTRRGGLNLVGGQLATLRIDYHADPAGAQAFLRWTSPSTPLQIVPSTQLFPAAP